MWRRPLINLRTWLAVALPVLIGCGQVRETLPARSAHEQLLISTAADRALERLPAGMLRGKRIWLDVSNLDAYDRPYVVVALRRRLLAVGALLAKSAAEAEVVLEPASGALSINRREHLVGLPSIPLPVPFAGTPLTLPEVALFKAVYYRGRAKFIFAAYDPSTGEKAFDAPTCQGDSLSAFWWLLLFGPFEAGDLPRPSRQTPRLEDVVPRRRE